MAVREDGTDPEMEEFLKQDFEGMSHEQAVAQRDEIRAKIEPHQKWLKDNGFQLDPASFLSARLQGVTDLLMKLLGVEPVVMELFVHRRELQMLDMAKEKISEQMKLQRQQQLLQTALPTEQEMRNLGLFGNNGKPQ